MRRVLFIAYSFPPCSGGGVMRARAFAKYLPQHGWQPIVLTVDDQYYLSHTRDEALMTELAADLAVYRTKSLEPRSKLASNFKSSVYGLQKQRKFFDRLIKPVLRQVYHSFIIPDEHILWLPYAIRTGLQLITQHNIDAILVTTPPHSAGVIATILSRLTGKPLIWDVRDDWVNNPLFDSGPWHRRAFSRILERQIVRTARRIVTVTQESVAAFAAKYPAEADGKLELIPNGFDHQEFATLDMDAASGPDGHGSASKKLHLVYIGTLNAKRSPICLFEAIKQLCNELPLEEQLKLDIYGYSRADFQEISASMGLEGIVKFHGFVSRAESLRQLLLSDAALMLIPEEEGSDTAIPGKLYEYIGAQKFVLGLCPTESAAGRLIGELSIGTVCSPNDTPQIKQALHDMLTRFEQGRLETRLNHQQINIFERSAQARCLAHILNGIG